MQLTVPEKTIADTDSFPVAPAAVEQWLSTLNIPDSEADLQDLYQGLKHSNRLHNDISQRRLVIGYFIPALRAAHVHLSGINRAQALPLTAEFAHAARLQDSLLREEAVSFKILLRDSDAPAADDARRAMQALAKQAEAIAHSYRHFPEDLISDAHQLYALAEEHDLLSSNEDPELASLVHHYRYILLLSVAGLTQQRIRQLPLLIQFLQHACEDINIERSSPAQSALATSYAINLEQGSLPEPATAILITNAASTRWFSISPILTRIAETCDDIDSRRFSGGKVLERHSLIRMQNALTRSRDRRLSRCISAQPHRVIVGQKEICARILYHMNDHPGPKHEMNWSAVNHNSQGMCLHHPNCRAGLLQVGELISVTDETQSFSPINSQSNQFDVTIGVVRWVLDRATHGVMIGVEFLTRTAIPVHVTRDTQALSKAISQDSATVERGAKETALIMACKIQNEDVQTILLPPHVYRSGDKLLAWQGPRSLNLQLNQCLQANGLFSQYSL